MAALVWDKTGERRIETGVDHCALYVYDPTQKTYGKGVAWNGITAISEKPEGAEATDLYADNILYLSMLSAEKLKATIEAYTYPDEFEQCDGSATLTKGVKIGQQDDSPSVSSTAPRSVTTWLVRTRATSSTSCTAARLLLLRRATRPYRMWSL